MATRKPELPFARSRKPRVKGSLRKARLNCAGKQRTPNKKTLKTWAAKTQAAGSTSPGHRLGIKWAIIESTKSTFRLTQFVLLEIPSTPFFPRTLPAWQSAFPPRTNRLQDEKTPLSNLHILPSPCFLPLCLDHSKCASHGAQMPACQSRCSRPCKHLGKVGDLATLRCREPKDLPT